LAHLFYELLPDAGADFGSEKFKLSEVTSISTSHSERNNPGREWQTRSTSRLVACANYVLPHQLLVPWAGRLGFLDTFRTLCIAPHSEIRGFFDLLRTEDNLFGTPSR
jgi:hypothetical protein